MDFEEHISDLEQFWEEDDTEVTNAVKNIFKEVDKLTSKPLGEDKAIEFMKAITLVYLDTNFNFIKEQYLENKDSS